MPKRLLLVTEADVAAIEGLMQYADDSRIAYDHPDVVNFVERMKAVLPRPKASQREAKLTGEIHRLLYELTQTQARFTALSAQYEALKHDKRPRYASIRCPDCRKNHNHAPPIAEEPR